MFFGELGEGSINLINYFESIPGVAPKGRGVNPATWMLECIGAGTAATTSETDFHAHYKQSALCDMNTTKVRVLCPADPHDEINIEGGVADIEAGTDIESGPVPHVMRLHSVKLESRRHTPQYNVSYWTQFKVLMYRSALSYWRTPSYNFVRPIISVVIALLYSSTYADQTYSSDVDVISRVALIYITVLFLGVVGINTAKPVAFAERPAFYREQFSEIYDVKLYVLAGTLVEVL